MYDEITAICFKQRRYLLHVFPWISHQCDVAQPGLWGRDELCRTKRGHRPRSDGWTIVEFSLYLKGLIDMVTNAAAAYAGWRQLQMHNELCLQLYNPVLNITETLYHTFAA